jgi:hypothetical protein
MICSANSGSSAMSVRKVGLSMTATSVSTLASAAAARGASSISAISPNTPPGPTCSRIFPNVMTSTPPL